MQNNIVKRYSVINVRIEEKPSFKIVGRKIWISGQENEQFGVFWEESHKNGLINKLRELRNNTPGLITGSYVFGVSCVEKDPSDRAFDFFIATESDIENSGGDLENYIVPASKWAIFSNRGDLPMSLIDAEMYAFMEWLPVSEYKHANAPELEAYPANDDKLVEFWLPVDNK